MSRYRIQRIQYPSGRYEYMPQCNWYPIGKPNLVEWRDMINFPTKMMEDAKAVIESQRDSVKVTEETVYEE